MWFNKMEIDVIKEQNIKLAKAIYLELVKKIIIQELD